MKTIDKLKYLFTPLISGSLVGLIINKSIDYQMLIKPPVSPPKLAFPIAWTTIYILMGISFYLYKKKGLNKLDKLYYTQLIVNLLWSIIFFLFKFRLLSCIWIIILDLLVIKLISKFYKVDKKLSLLNLIYLIWILFATYLTIGIYLLN